MKLKLHIFDNMQHCWQHYLINPCCQLFIEIQNSLRIPVVDSQNIVSALTIVFLPQSQVTWTTLS
jgi:hypothetical protein